MSTGKMERVHDGTDQFAIADKFKKVASGRGAKYGKTSFFHVSRPQKAEHHGHEWDELISVALVNCQRAENRSKYLKDLSSKIPVDESTPHGLSHHSGMHPDSAIPNTAGTAGDLDVFYAMNEQRMKSFYSNTSVVRGD